MDGAATRLNGIGGDPWNQRRDVYRESPVHRDGDDLDTVVSWCEPAPGIRVLDVATGGGHVARRLRERGCEVVSCDAAAGMEPDVVCPAEWLAATGCEGETARHVRDLLAPRSVDSGKVWLDTKLVVKAVRT